MGYALLGGRCVDGKMERTTTEGVEEADMAGERACRNLTVRKWESEKHRSWCMSPMALDWEFQAGGALAGGQWCSSITTEMEPMHGMYGTLDAELKVQRTIKRSGLTAFLFLFRRIIGPTTAHFDNKGIIAEWRREMKCIGPKAKDVEACAQSRRSWWRSGTSKRIASRKEKPQLSLFIKFVAGAIKKLTSWEMMKQCWMGGERTDQGQHSPAETRGVLRSVAKCSQLSLSGGGMVRLWKNSSRTQKRSGHLWK